MFRACRLPGSSARELANASHWLQSRHADLVMRQHKTRPDRRRCDALSMAEGSSARIGAIAQHGAEKFEAKHNHSPGKMIDCWCRCLQDGGGRREGRGGETGAERRGGETKARETGPRRFSTKRLSSLLSRHRLHRLKRKPTPEAK